MKQDTYDVCGLLDGGRGGGGAGVSESPVEVALSSHQASGTMSASTSSLDDSIISHAIILIIQY